MVEPIQHPSLTQRINAWGSQAKSCAVQLTQNVDTFVRTKANAAGRAWNNAANPVTLPPAAGPRDKHRTDLLVMATKIGVVVGTLGCIYVSPIRAAAHALAHSLRTVAAVALLEAGCREIFKDSEINFGALDTIKGSVKMVRDGTLPDKAPLMKGIYRTWQGAEVAYAKWLYSRPANDAGAPATA